MERHTKRQSGSAALHVHDFAFWGRRCEVSGYARLPELQIEGSLIILTGRSVECPLSTHCGH